MNDRKDKSKELLKLQLTKLKNIQKIENGYNRTEVLEWITSTVLILEGIFGRDSLKLKEIEKIRNTKKLYYRGFILPIIKPLPSQWVNLFCNLVLTKLKI